MAKILVVDDVESDREIERVILERSGHEVFSAAGGADALRECLDKGIDVVITDLKMPDVHGFELITVLGDLSPRPPVIAVSGTGAYHLHMARQLGAVETLSKPVEAEALLRAVDRALEG